MHAKQTLYPQPDGSPSSLTKAVTGTVALRKAGHKEAIFEHGVGGVCSASKLSQKSGLAAIIPAYV